MCEDTQAHDLIGAHANDGHRYTPTNHGDVRYHGKAALIGYWFSNVSLLKDLATEHEKHVPSGARKGRNPHMSVRGIFI